MGDDRMRDHGDGSGDELIGRVATSLREPVALGGDFDDRVMTEVRAIAALEAAGRSDVRSIESARSTSPLSWIVRRRTVRISPLVGLAAAATISAITVLAPRVVDRSSTPVPTVASTEATTPVALVSTAAPSGTQSIQFVLVDSAAQSVALVGSFNDWDTSATRLRRGAGGVWSVELPLRAGRYTYSYVVDGTRWVADPAAQRSVDDDFGAPSSVLTVGPGALPR